MSSLRNVFLYLLGLAVAAAAVFFLAFFLGRRPSLELQLERLTEPPRPQGKTPGIPSLQPAPPPEPSPEPPVMEGETLGEGIRVRRSPRAEAGLVLGLDLEALSSLETAGRDGSRKLLEGLDLFFASPPPGLRIGLRAIGGAAGDCGETTLVKACGLWSAAELHEAIAAAGIPRLRNPLGGVVQGFADLEEVPGVRSVVLLVGGADGCSVDLCAAALPPGMGSSPIHVILLAPAPTGGEAPPEAAAPVFEPPWAASYRCLAERSGGAFLVAASPEDIAGHLRRIAQAMEALVAVRMFHFAGREVQGVSPEGSVGWGVSLSATGDGVGAGLAREQLSLPATFAAAAGTHLLRCRYGGQEKTVAVAVAPQERADVQVEFVTGEIFVQARDEGGNELLGDTTGFRCLWGAAVLPAGEEKPLGSTCNFPARFELPTGSYRLRVWGKGKEQVLEEVPVEAAETTVRTVVFGKE